jgi:hypothetical protein
MVMGAMMTIRKSQIWVERYYSVVCDNDHGYSDEIDQYDRSSRRIVVDPDNFGSVDRALADTLGLTVDLVWREFGALITDSVMFTGVSTCANDNHFRLYQDGALTSQVTVQHRRVNKVRRANVTRMCRLAVCTNDPGVADTLYEVLDVSGMIP